MLNFLPYLWGINKYTTKYLKNTIKMNITLLNAYTEK